MPIPAVVGVDIGTSSSKGVLVGLDGRMLAASVVEHDVQRPGPGMFEMDGAVWWDEFVTLVRRLLAEEPADVRAVGVSGMGPCVLLDRRGRRAAASGDPLRRRHPRRPTRSQD